MSKPPTIDRKTLKLPDVFVQRGTQLLGKLSTSRVGLIPILIIGVVIAGLFFAYDQWDERREQKAWTAFYRASKAEATKKWDEYKTVHAQWPKSRAAMLAAVELGDFYYGTEAGKEAQQAGDWYSKALEFNRLLPVEKQLLLMNRGNALELLKKWNESLADYEQAYGMNGPAKGLALLAIARVQLEQGQLEKSAETYQKVMTEFPGTEYGKTAKNHWRKLKSPLLRTEAGR